MAAPIVHVVFLQFKPELAAEERREVCETRPSDLISPDNDDVSLCFAWLPDLSGLTPLLV